MAKMIVNGGSKKIQLKEVDINKVHFPANFMKRVKQLTNMLDDRRMRYQAVNKINFNFLNSGKEDSALFMSLFFETAESEVNLFVRDLNGDVSNADYVKSLEKFLMKEHVKLKLLFEDKPSKITPAMDLIFKEDFSQKVNVKYLRNANNFLKYFLDPLLFRKKSIHHIAIADNRLYRLEFDTENYMAKANFNDPTTAVKLKMVFDFLFQQGVECEMASHKERVFA